MENKVAYIRRQNEVPNRIFGHSNRNKQWVETEQSPTSLTLGEGVVIFPLKIRLNGTRVGEAINY